MKKYRVDRIGNSQLSSSFLWEMGLWHWQMANYSPRKSIPLHGFRLWEGGGDKGGVEIKRGKQQLKKSNINALIVYEKASNETLQCSIIRRLISKVLIHFTAILNTT